ncbi:MAG: pyroglutamyl-peptidase I [Anaerolineaceae bacterium]|nr:pyroglutamyl-peptidase I [Anaerolineaceae bacterium]
MNILITGFEAYGKRKKNATEEAVHQLSAHEFWAAGEPYLEILPVVHIEATEKLSYLLQKISPDIVICLGEAGGRSAISLEKIAINYLDYLIPDNVGNKISDCNICKEGPDAFFTSLPVISIRKRLISSGIPAEISLTAGTFLCNEIFYQLMNWADRQEKKVIAGFIHIPILPDVAARMQTPTASMATFTVIEALQIAIETSYNVLQETFNKGSL